MEPKKLSDGSFYTISEPKRLVLDNEGVFFVGDVLKVNDKYWAIVTLASSDPQPMMVVYGDSEEDAMVKAVEEFKKQYNV